ncbi:MerR family transcriptional regulator [Cytobacillus praedii]|uniref:MerR family transcriptional regulator n=1 Tax=Cytobacillus praedii TaxID=1742358 RepID=A0A4R1AWU6_9BACI|nr:MerR family transcriptional regulator [Cytobacillus praedii]MED3551408.1 MerR family transcriptional regulator [Cytobacillus praedii]MED3572530.1 MerR family transcriptional regulator [Cytobacillus praedii]TCJ04960.1 MerR family transcriptional regulator [Cytobacillus praedii]
MGELATIANVSKRTIDYYTNIGLIQAKRTKSNYRIYSEDVLSDLRFIEECKLMHIPLDEIKRKLELKSKTDMHTGDVEKQIDLVTKQIKQLHNEIAVLLPLINHLDKEQISDLSRKLNTEGSTLIKSLVSLTS